MERALERTRNGNVHGRVDLLDELLTARVLETRDRQSGWSALNRLFRLGEPPLLPDGDYTGEFVAIDVAPALTQLLEFAASLWMPWKGKAFNASSREGTNILSRDSLALAHLLWPFYRDYREDGPCVYRAFPFVTYTAPGLYDPDRRVLKIDYNLAVNPKLSVRRVLDELVQLSGGFYLGKANVKWWWGSWQTVAFFTLSQIADGGSQIADR